MKTALSIWIVASAVSFATPSVVLAQNDASALPDHFCATSEFAPEDCSFTSMAMCEQSVSGVGGSCAPQSASPAMPPRPMFQLFDRTPAAAFPPTAVPPPPMTQQSPGPLQLPDALPTQR
jgi:hypothetical protein